MPKVIKFKEELKALLEKYEAIICFECSNCSDTFGIHNEKITVRMESDKIKSTLSDGWSVNTTDL